MFGLCNQNVIRWFTVQKHSDSCNFVAAVAAAKVGLSNTFSDSVILQLVFELWLKASQEEFVWLCALVVCQGLQVWVRPASLQWLLTCCST